MKKHNALSMIELLGAIAIFAIASSIIALTISLILNANKDIVETGQANTTGTIIMKQIENALNDMNITSYDLDQNNKGIIIYSESEYIINNLGEIILFEHSPILELSIEINTEILLDNVALDRSQFTIHQDSQIQIITDSISSTLIITIVLASNDDNLYTFKTSLILP